MKISVEPVHILLPPSEGRSSGVHVSTIIRMISQETGILRPEWCEELSLVEITPSTRFLDPVVALRVSIGLAWESFYISKILSPEGVIDHPGEYYVDGIYMSPDGEELAQIIVDRRPQHKMKVHEVKATYKSTNTVGETEDELNAQFMWMSQIKSYCKGAGTTLADLHVLFLCGDYSFPIAPQKKRFRFEFTEEEIEDNWSLVTNYRDQRLVIEGGI